MKKQILITLIIISSGLTMNAQIWNGSTIADGNIWRNGNIGIGTSDPYSKLTIGISQPLFLNSGGSSTTPFLAVLNSPNPSVAPYGWAFYDNQTNGNLDIYRRNGTVQGEQTMSFNRNTGDISIGSVAPLFLNRGGSSTTPFLAVLNSPNPSVAPYGWAFYDNQTNGNLDIYRRNGTVQGEQTMSFNRNTGDVGIGTKNPAYKLDVLGTIRAREIKVDLNGADFVFESSYKLMPLNELEKFTKEQKHLPEIAPAKEMEKNGTDLGVLTSKLLQKIEELTLYTIEQNKKIIELEEQNKTIEELKQMVKLQSEKLERIVATSK
jgi:hypothetical protein